MKTYGLPRNHNAAEENLTKFGGFTAIGSKKLAHKKAAYKKLLHRQARRTAKQSLEY